MQNNIHLPQYDEICKLLQKYGVSYAGLFGSRAFGDASPTSDYDIVVEFSPDSKTTFLGMIELKLKLEDILHAKVDLLTKDSISPHFRKYIVPTIIPFYETKN